MSTVDLRLTDISNMAADLSTVENWIMNGQVTFFVGAAASSGEADFSEGALFARETIASRMRNLMQKFEDENDPSRYAAELRFLKAFAQAYLPSVNINARSEFKEKSPNYDAIVELSRNLVVLLARLTHAFDTSSVTHGIDVKQEPGGQSDRYYFNGHLAELSLDPGSHREVFIAILGVLDAAKAIPHAAVEMPHQHRDSLWGDSLRRTIYHEMCSMVAMHVPFSVWKEQGWKQHDVGYSRNLDALNRTFRHAVGTSPIMRVDLEWLSDFLWLLVRIDLPLYPTSHELAVELGVFSEKLIPPTPILSKSAEISSDYKNVCGYIAGRIGLKNEHATDGHFVLAAALIHMTQAELKNRPRPSGKEAIDRQIKKISGPPILVTTNFDSGIEFALEKTLTDRRSDGHSLSAPSGYRVVFPVLVRKTDEYQADAVYSVRWVVKDKRWNETGRGTTENYYIVLPPSRDRETGGNNNDPLLGEMAQFKGMFLPENINLKNIEALRFENETNNPIFPAEFPPAPGPVIVKIHGSPLEPLDYLKRGGGLEWLHYIIVSEFHYVRALADGQRSDPSFLESLFSHPSRHLVFVGYSLGDWNIRVALAQHAHRALNKTNQRSSGDDPSGSSRVNSAKRVAIVKDRNFADLALFHRLDVSTAQQDIRTLIKGLARQPYIGNILPPEIHAHLIK